MAKNTWKYSMENTLNRWEQNFEKNETKITYIFAISIALCPTFFSLLATGVGEMTTVWAIGFGISFWALLISGLLLFRNSSRTETNRRLIKIESQLNKLDTLIESQEKLTSSINNLTSEIRKDREDRNKSKTP
jgi:hypothetical protein